MFVYYFMKSLCYNLCKIRRYRIANHLILCHHWTKKLKIIGIAISDELAETKQAMADLNISWTVLSDPEGLSARIYGISAIPAMILFGPDGTIVARDFLLSELDTLIK